MPGLAQVVDPERGRGRVELRGAEVQDGPEASAVEVLDPLVEEFHLRLRRGQDQRLAGVGRVRPGLSDQAGGDQPSRPDQE